MISPDPQFLWHLELHSDNPKMFYVHTLFSMHISSVKCFVYILGRYSQGASYLVVITVELGNRTEEISTIWLPPPSGSHAKYKQINE